MKLLLFFLLACCAVKCDNNYYVIEMGDSDTYKEPSRPFKVFWNVPTMQCKSKKIPFTDLYQKYGILQNKNDSFRGEMISILYDPGLFPALLKNETSGKFKFRNGGVPQEGNIDKHIYIFKNILNQSIPDEEFSGVGIIDFESWRPIFRQNFGVLVPYKDVSYEIEKKLHWWWSKPWIQVEAKRRFEDAARAFMQTTLSIAKQMRPNAVWGYYGFPYCFNMANNHLRESCADKVPEENNRLHWLWAESTALYPSVYSTVDLTSFQLAALIRGRVEEAERVKNKAIVLPYFWFRYRDGGYFTEGDLKTALSTLYKSNASGFIIWGSSNDVNTVAKCTNLLEYLEKIMGPAIAEYTKPSIKLREKFQTMVTETKTTSKPELNRIKPNFDPEFHWVPPENYTEDIEQNVEEEIKKKPGYNLSVIDKINGTVFKDLNDTIFVDWLLYNKENVTDISPTEPPITTEKKNGSIVDTTASSEQINNDLESSQLFIDSITEIYNDNNSLDVIITTSEKSNFQTGTLYETSVSNVDYTTENSEITREMYSRTEKSTSTKEIYKNLPFFNQNIFLDNDIGDFKEVIQTDSSNSESIVTNHIRKDTVLNNDVTTQYTISPDKERFSDGIKETYTALVPTTTVDQVRSGTQLVVAPKPYLCLIFYVYSMAQCLCKMFGKCS